MGLKFKGVTQGVDVTLAGSAKDVSLDTVYSQDSVTATAKVVHGLSNSSTAVSISGVLGVDVDAANPAAPSDYNVGAEYTQKDLTASLVTSSQGNDITASYFQKIGGDLNLGSSMLVKPSGTRLFTFGGEYALDKCTALKAKADSKGIVGTSITHTLAKPALKFCISAQFDALSSDILAAQKLGVSLTF